MIVDLLVLLALIAVVAMVLAPLESLHWWATKGADGKGARAMADDHADLEEQLAEDLDELTDQAEAATPAKREGPKRFVVYLSGIGALAAGDIPQEEVPFLLAIRERLPGWTVIDDVFPYAVDRRGLTSERMLGGLWRALGKLRLRNPNAVLASLINVRNVLQMFVCADRRYGPSYNVGTAVEISRSLQRHGHRPGDADEVVLLGWSGGAQIALGAVWYLQPLLEGVGALAGRHAVR